MALSSAVSTDSQDRPGVFRRYRGILKQIENRVRAMSPEINRANRAMFRLADLSEDMRILSLNAELAAGRAGSRGAAVRALTQYTRGLVRRLIEINESASGLPTLYRTSAATLRTLRHLRQLEEATVLVDTVGAPGSALDALSILEKCRAVEVQEIVGHIQGINDGTTRLGVMVRVVDDIVSQAASIATNIAAEAVSAGVHEAEFRAVAETMTRYVEELRTMNDEAARGLRGAFEGCRALLEIAAALSRKHAGPVVRLDR
ncbi:MAG: chemotaxis protein [Azospirillum sp.]|nr:chemotaxis protein [Azospirillum sp.]